MKIRTHGRPFFTTALQPMVAAVIAAFFLIPSFCPGAECRDLVENIGPYGAINWSKGLVLAKGMGIPGDCGPSDQATEDTSATRAERDTTHNLLQVIRKLRINTLLFLQDMLEDNDMIQDQLQGMVKNAKTVKREYLSDGTVETTLAMEMQGGLAQLALPQEIRPVPEIKTLDNPEGQKEMGQKADRPPSNTGIVVDARGLKGVPALSPRIVNEKGEEVFGPTYASREFAVQQGMVSYETDMDGAKNNPRVAGNPLTVQCLRAEGPMPCDFVISNADAARIGAASENLALLKQCKVVIVLD